MRKLPILLLSLAAACGSSKPAPQVGEDNQLSRAGDPGSSPPDDPSPPATLTKPVTNATLAAVGLDPTAIDRSVDPCQDFYQFACGTWIKHTEIAADKPLAMRSFVDIADRNQAFEHAALEKMAKTPSKDPVEKSLGAFYGACMNETAIEKVGLRPIAPLRAAIDRIKDARSLSAAIAQLHAAGFGVLFSYGSQQDAKDAKNNIGAIDQGGLGLGDRDYYLSTEPDFVDKRAKYQDYVTKVLTAVGHKPDAAAKEAADILALETELAKVSKSNVEQRDPVNMYNRLERGGVAKAMPSFDWATFWKATGQTSDAVTVGAPAFLAGTEPLLTKTPAATWRAYLTFHLVSEATPFLTKKLIDEGFQFQAAMVGVKEQRPRWKRCISYTDAALGDLLGQVFVRDKFPGESKTAALAQVSAITTAMKVNLDALPWMDKTTKERAFKKLAQMTYQIGYPNKWRTYAFKIDPKAFGATALAAQKAETARDFAKIGKPDDRDEWGMTTPTVNAYYNPARNGMVFPAGILQSPFYSVSASIPVNLGGMGMVVGHELTHGFDDEGAQYDGDGNLADWWEPATKKEFQTRTACVKNQYDNYTIAGVKLKGALTAGENIADIGGVKLALTAYRALRSTANDTVVADGYTEDQQFFLAFGQAWCAKARPEYEKRLAATDPHSPSQWRVNGALQATPAFAKAFSCKLGSAMAPAKACVVW